jgi:peptidyl-prolyl cis-trans isomerase SurA
MLRPLIATLAVLILAAAPLAHAQKGGRASGGRPGGPPSSINADRPVPPPQAMPAPAPAAPGAAAAAAPPPGELLDRVVAIVNDGVVLESEVRDEIAAVTASARAQNRKLPPADEVRRQVLEQLITQQVMLQRAERKGLKVDDEYLNEVISDRAKANGLTLQQLPTVMAQQGIDYATYREDMRNKIVMATLQEQEVRSKINITPRELEQYQERLKRLPGENDEYNVSDILIAIPTDATQAQVKELEQKARDIYERALKEDFAQLAFANSNASTATSGGALGWRKGSNLPTDLAETIVMLKPGEVSKPVPAVNGFHILKLHEMRRGEQTSPIQDQVHVRHILVRTNTMQDDATVKLKLAGVRQKVLDGQDFAAFAATMSEDKGSAVDGGEIEWVSPDEFDPEFKRRVAALKEGEISEPFQSSFGWHIVQLLGRRSFDITEDSLRERAFRQLRDSKADAELETWIRHLRDEAFIDTDL